MVRTRSASAPPADGSPRLQGQRLPTLATVLHEVTTCWGMVTVRGGDGESARVVEITSATAIWSHSGMPPLPIRWGLVRDPQGEFAPQALLRTDWSVEPVPILAWFVLRWRLAVTWQETRASLGMETPRP